MLEIFNHIQGGLLQGGHRVDIIDHWSIIDHFASPALINMRTFVAKRVNMRILRNFCGQYLVDKVLCGPYLVDIRELFGGRYSIKPQWPA